MTLRISAARDRALAASSRVEPGSGFSDTGTASAAQGIAMLDHESFEALELGDAVLIAVEWSESGQDLSIRLEHADGRVIVLVCTWAHSRRIELVTSAQEGGRPLLWAAHLTPAEPHFRLQLDFSAHGIIELLCNEVLLAPQA